jgi:hypothetical protein
MRTGLKIWLQLAFERHTVARGVAYAVVVGGILILINHFDLITGDGQFTTARLVKMGLTIVVPYLVSTFSSVGAQLACGRSVSVP